MFLYCDTSLSYFSDRSYYEDDDHLSADDLELHYFIQCGNHLPETNTLIYYSLLCDFILYVLIIRRKEKYSVFYVFVVRTYD